MIAATASGAGSRMLTKAYRWQVVEGERFVSVHDRGHADTLDEALEAMAPTLVTYHSSRGEVFRDVGRGFAHLEHVTSVAGRTAPPIERAD
jgi:hypothetical protein